MVAHEVSFRRRWRLRGMRMAHPASRRVQLPEERQDLLPGACSYPKRSRGAFHHQGQALAPRESSGVPEQRHASLAAQHLVALVVHAARAQVGAPVLVGHDARLIHEVPGLLHEVVQSA